MNPLQNQTCRATRDLFSSYLDGAISGREMQSVATHLGNCADCQRDFDVFRGMQHALAAIGPIKAPADLGLKLRLAISHESARRQGHWWDGLSLQWDNLLRPMLVQFGAGLASALFLIGGLITLVGVVAAPQAVLAHDEPLGALTAPHYLYSAARLQPVDPNQDGTIVIEADINADGRVYNYTFLSGSVDPHTQAEIRDHLMLQVYEPARVFGEPVRGQVLITFSGVSVNARG